jgi:hypothetical protein
MCGVNQKTDLAELLSERRMKSQIRGKRIHQPTVRLKYFSCGGAIFVIFVGPQKRSLQQQGCNVMFDPLNLTG